MFKKKYIFHIEYFKPIPYTRGSKLFQSRVTQNIKCSWRAKSVPTHTILSIIQVGIGILRYFNIF